MKKIEINDYFKSQYLTCGNTRDNYIFHNCPEELLLGAYNSLEEDCMGIKSCMILINRTDEENIEKTLSDCSSIQKLMLYRDYVNARVLKEVYKNQHKKEDDYNMLKDLIESFNDGDILKVKKYHTYAPFMYEIIDEYRKGNKFEVNFFLVNTENELLLRAVNNYISSRTPFSVKVFTDLECLPTYVDEGGQLIECPHDYLTMNVHNFIELKDFDDIPER